MKRICAILLVLCLLLCACSSAPESSSVSTESVEPTPTPVVSSEGETTAEPTPEPTTEPTPTPAPWEPMYTYWNPLTGEELSEPHTSRIYTVTINNVPVAFPHLGVNDADIFFEMLVNDYSTRGLAMYADPTGVGPIGSVRSTRYNFTDICVAYDAIIAHASANQGVLDDQRNRGVDNLDADVRYFYRDQGRLNSGYAYEHTLFIKGDDLPKYAGDLGYRTENEAGKQYGLSFTADAALEGEDANSISFWFWNNSRRMVYNAELDKYEFWQAGEVSYDGTTGTPEAFKNVLLLQMEVYNQDVYHLANMDGSGTGYYACGGKIVPIQWHHEAEDMPFTFTYADGTRLDLEIGNSYVGFIPLEDEISWE